MLNKQMQMRQSGEQTMSKKNMRSLLCARSGSLTGNRFVFAFLASLIASQGFAANKDSASGEVVSFVHSAAALIEQTGEAAFPKFRQAGGKWFHGDQYVFVWGLDGMRYVYPPDPSGEGENMRGLKDVKGKPIGEWFIAGCTTSGPARARSFPSGKALMFSALSPLLGRPIWWGLDGTTCPSSLLSSLRSSTTHAAC